MKLQRLMMLGLAVAALAACEKNEGPFTAPDVPTAYVRYVHAVADTGALELRFIDKVEGSQWYGQPAFRSITNYLPIDAGERRFRIFPVDPNNNINIVSQIVIEHTATFEANKYYTLLHTGYARAGATPADRIVVLEDPVPTPASGQIAVRAVHAGAGMGTLDVYATDTAAAAALPGSAMFQGLTYESSSAFGTLAPGPLSFRATASGTPTPVVARGNAPVGAEAATSSQSRQAGFSIAGSVLTAFIFPRSVAGSAAPQTTAFTSPAVVWMQDNEP
jgi:hypothetical protein